MFDLLSQVMCSLNSVQGWYKYYKNLDWSFDCLQNKFHNWR